MNRDTELDSIEIIRLPDSSSGNLLELLDLKRLLVLKQSNSYTEAAYRLAISEAHLRRKISVLELNVGFKLIMRKSGKALSLTNKAKLWLRSFDELGNSLCSLNEAIANAHQSDQKLHIGIHPSLTFSDTLWERFLKKHHDAGFKNLNFDLNPTEEQLLDGYFVAIFSMEPSTNEKLTSRLVYQDHLIYYQADTAQEALPSDKLTVILWSFMTKERAVTLLRDIPDFKDKEIQFISASNVSEAMQYVSRHNGILISIPISADLSPANVTHFSLPNKETVSVYLTFPTQLPLNPIFEELTK